MGILPHSGTLIAICQRRRSSRCGSFSKSVASRRRSFLFEKPERPSVARPCSLPRSRPWLTTFAPICGVMSNVTGFRSGLVEPAHAAPPWIRRFGAEEPNHRHRRLLRARTERPCDRRAAEQRDELAPSHVQPLIRRLHPTTQWQEIPRCASQQIWRPMSQLVHSRRRQPRPSVHALPMLSQFRGSPGAPRSRPQDLLTATRQFG